MRRQAGVYVTFPCSSAGPCVMHVGLPPWSGPPRAPLVGEEGQAEDSHFPGPTYGALDRTAELLAKLLSASEDPDVTALSEALKAKLGITEPLPKPALASPFP